MNLAKANKVIEFVRSLGVIDFCLCAGARNSPFITLLDENKSLLEERGNLFHFFEERSASFFALGRAQQSQRPVAVITTSGTAATELVSATVEAFYTKTPLILITADRPPSYRGTGAPQSIEQLGLFTHYALPTVDLHEDLSALEQIQWNKEIPLHLNVCFAEPLLQGPIPVLNASTAFVNALTSDASYDADSADSFGLRKFLSSSKHPLFIISGLSRHERVFVGDELKDFAGAWWIESLSGLRGHPDLEDRRIKSGESFVQYLLAKNIFDSIIRIGSVPTTRAWRDLEEKFKLPVLSLSNGSWSGLARPSTRVPLGFLRKVLEHYRNTCLGDHVATAERMGAGTGCELGLSEDLKQKDRTLAQKISAAIDLFPNSQLSLVRQLSNLVNEQPLYLGNSLPVREWDWVAKPTLPSAISGNRGANGIDGQLSTFFGWMPESLHSWALLGDLTTLYDLSAPWILSQLHNHSWTLAVMNNSGGHIFKPMFGREAFINRHPLGFEAWAKMWGLTYCCLDSLVGDFSTLPQILELRPSEEQSQQLRQQIEQIWQTHLL